METAEKNTVNPRSTLANRRLAFLNRVINHFNQDNRGVIPESTFNCSYYYGCAIGREIPDLLARRLYDRVGPYIKGFSDVILDRYFPPALKALGYDFLKDVQSLHDDKLAWDEKGLTGFGKFKLSNIVKEYNLNPLNQ